MIGLNLIALIDKKRYKRATLFFDHLSSYSLELYPSDITAIFPEVQVEDHSPQGFQRPEAGEIVFVNGALCLITLKDRATSSEDSGASSKNDLYGICIASPLQRDITVRLPNERPTVFRSLEEQTTDRQIVLWSFVLSSRCVSGIQFAASLWSRASQLPVALKSLVLETIEASLNCFQRIIVRP